MIAIERRLYRGTTIAWPGNRGLQLARMTPTTTDPLVAAIFAIECARHGRAVIYVARMSDSAPFLAPGNVLGETECELGISLPPLDFIARMAFGTISVEAARRVFSDMSLELPATISSRRGISRELAHFPRMTAEQITEFEMRCPVARIDHAAND